MSADDVFLWGNWVLVGALVVGVVATYAIVASGNIRDKELKLEIADANARGEEAKAEAAKANLELERFKAPRTLTVEQRVRITEKLKAFHGTIFEVVTYPGDSEPLAFMNLIAETLVRAGWEYNIKHGRSFLLSVASGVVVVVSTKAPPKADEAGKALLASLISEGVAARLGYDSLQVNPTTIAIKIQVGTKH
jgi:hypothetical protein